MELMIYSFKINSNFDWKFQSTNKFLNRNKHSRNHFYKIADTFKLFKRQYRFKTVEIQVRIYLFAVICNFISSLLFKI